MGSGPFALALAAGMAATVNPCGFAMLPAYLAMFLGDGTPEGSTSSATVPRAFVVSGVLTVGFVAVFGLFGLAIAPLAVQVEQYLPWVTIVIGIALVGLGVVMLAGRQLTLAVPKLAKGGTDGGLRSMFLFGVSYAVASLSCTIGPFLAVTSTTLRGRSSAEGVAMFVVYGLGMGLVVTALTVSVALAKAGLVNRLRGSLGHITRISGVLLVVAGAYVAWFGWFEVRVLSGSALSDPVIDRASSVQQWLQNLVVSSRPVVTAAWLAGLLAVVAVIVGARRRLARASDDDPSAGHGLGSDGVDPLHQSVEDLESVEPLGEGTGGVTT